MPKGTALITGASSGIGLELARVFGHAGYDLLLVARRANKLRALARELRELQGIDATAIPMDLARAGAAEALYASIRKRKRHVDVLVNNAGALVSGDVRTTKVRHHLNALQLNVVVPTVLTQRFVKHMVDRGSGRILNVSSIAAFQPLARLAVYASSKAYLLHFTEALSEELRGTGVTATALCPGFTDTGMMSTMPDTSWLPAFAVGSAEQVARDGYDACMAGEPLYVSGAANQVATGLMRYQPRWFLRAVSGWASRRFG